MSKETIETFDNNYMYKFKTSDVWEILNIINKEDTERKHEFKSSHKDIDYTISREKNNQRLKSIITITLDNSYENKELLKIFKSNTEEISFVKDMRIDCKTNEYLDTLELKIWVREEFYGLAQQPVTSDMFQFPAHIKLAEHQFQLEPYKTLSFMNSIIIDIINLFDEIKNYEGDFTDE